MNEERMHRSYFAHALNDLIRRIRRMLEDTFSFDAAQIVPLSKYFMKGIKAFESLFTDISYDFKKGTGSTR